MFVLENRAIEIGSYLCHPVFPADQHHPAVPWHQLHPQIQQDHSNQAVPWRLERQRHQYCQRHLAYHVDHVVLPVQCCQDHQSNLWVLYFQQIRSLWSLGCNDVMM